MSAAVEAAVRDRCYPYLFGYAEWLLGQALAFMPTGPTANAMREFLADCEALPSVATPNRLDYRPEDYPRP